MTGFWKLSVGVWLKRYAMIVIVAITILLSHINLMRVAIWTQHSHVNLTQSATDAILAQIFRMIQYAYALVKSCITEYQYGNNIIAGSHWNSLCAPEANGYKPQFDSKDDQFSIFLGILHAYFNQYPNSK